MSIRNIIKFARSKKGMSALTWKAIARLQERGDTKRQTSNLEWIQAQVVDVESLIPEPHKNTWDEAIRESTQIASRAKKILRDLQVTLGGGGHHALLYFLARAGRPTSSLETGVASGFSSSAILAALHKNGHGHLFSSDLPYFRLENPEQYVGIIVPEEHKDRWTLSIEGDKIALPTFAREAKSIDLVHYDSDKSRKGRDFFMQTVKSHLAPDALILFDDIQDNSHFRDLATSSNLTFSVLEFQGKYVGVLGSIADWLQRPAATSH